MMSTEAKPTLEDMSVTLRERLAELGVETSVQECRDLILADFVTRIRED